MPLSQIDMVVVKEDGRKAQVCGDYRPKEGRVPEARLHVVVRQGDTVARGDGDCGTDRWVVMVDAEGGQLHTGPAVACAVAIVQLDTPHGLGSLVWVQQVEIESERTPPTDRATFPDPELVVTTGGALAAGRSVSSSLDVVGEPRAGGTVGWRHEVEVRPVARPPAP